MVRIRQRRAEGGRWGRWGGGGGGGGRWGDGGGGEQRNAGTVNENSLSAQEKFNKRD